MTLCQTGAYNSGGSRRSARHPGPRSIPPGTAGVTDGPGDDGWADVRLQVERLDWVPAILAGLSARFTVDQPAELRHLVRELAARLTAAADGFPLSRRDGIDRR